MNLLHLIGETETLLRALLVLILRDLDVLGVHAGELEALALNRFLNILLGGADLAGHPQMSMRMDGLSRRCRPEKPRYLVVALRIGLLGERQVAPVGLTLAREGAHQILRC